MNKLNELFNNLTSIGVSVAIFYLPDKQFQDLVEKYFRAPGRPKGSDIPTLTFTKAEMILDGVTVSFHKTVN